MLWSLPLHAINKIDHFRELGCEVRSRQDRPRAFARPCSSIRTRVFACPQVLLIEAKDVRVLKIQLAAVVTKDRCDKLIEHIHKFAFPSSSRTLFAYFHPSDPKLENGWEVYQPTREFNRLLARAPGRWRISLANNLYELCPSYPNRFVVPATVEDKQLQEVAKFRSRGRIPMLVYIHTNGTTLCRCSQPKVCGVAVGVRRGRCPLAR